MQEVQGLHEKKPYSSTAQEDRQQRVNEFISCLERDELLSPREEAHWRQVESRVPHPPESERWIHVGKAKSLHSSVPNRSHPSSNEELVLGRLNGFWCQASNVSLVQNFFLICALLAQAHFHSLNFISNLWKILCCKIFSKIIVLKIVVNFFMFHCRFDTPFRIGESTIYPE